MMIEEPQKISQDSSSPEHNLDSQDGSLTDHEYNTGSGKSPGGPQPMAPGVFLTQRRPSTSSQNNNSTTTTTTTNTTAVAKGDRGASADAKGELEEGWISFAVLRPWSKSVKFCVHMGILYLA